jgi:hypothetical protein
MTAPLLRKALATATVAVIRAELTNLTCSALGLTGSGYAPCFDLCRRLLAHGIPRDTPLEVFRAGVLALRVRTVGEGAQLTVRDDNRGTPRFRRVSPGIATAPPIAPDGDPFPPPPPAQTDAPGSSTRMRAP